MTKNFLQVFPPKKVVFYMKPFRKVVWLCLAIIGHLLWYTWYHVSQARVRCFSCCWCGEYKFNGTIYWRLAAGYVFNGTIYWRLAAGYVFNGAERQLAVIVNQYTFLFNIFSNCHLAENLNIKLWLASFWEVVWSWGQSVSTALVRIFNNNSLEKMFA